MYNWGNKLFKFLFNLYESTAVVNTGPAVIEVEGKVNSKSIQGRIDVASNEERLERVIGIKWKEKAE